jgi:hypothetical protein
MAMQWRILKPADLKLGDVVCYNRDEGFPFDDMEVVKIDHLIGVYLRRPYITEEGAAAYEECYWNLDSDFEFRLLRRA